VSAATHELKPLRVALIILHAEVERGGAERYTQDLRLTLRRRGHDVSLLTTSGEADVVLPTPEPRRAARYRSFCRQLRERLDGFDIVHAMLPLIDIDVDIYHPHAGMAVDRGDLLSYLINPRRRLFAEAERQHATSDRTIFLTLSNYVSCNLSRLHPKLPPDRVRRLFNGVDTDLFRHNGPRTKLGPGSIVLFCGNDWARKGLADVMRAIATTDARLVVVGTERPRVEAWHRRLAGWLKLGDRVAWLGRQEDVAAIYRSATLLCHASRHDPCSLATLEALACGLPVVGTPMDGATEVMTDGVHGRVVQPASLATALADALANRDAMATAVHELRPRLSWSAHVDRLEAIYREAVRRRDRADPAATPFES
jgi:glycosyltransferase involved in cell wall biosynthesis